MKTNRNPIAVALSAILIANIAMPYGLAANAAPANAQPAVQQQNAKNVMLGNVLRTIAQRYELILGVSGQAQKGDASIDGLNTERKTELNARLEERIAGLKAGTITPEAVRQEVLETNKAALAQQKQDLFYQVQNLSAEKLDELADGMKGNANYRDFNAQYAAAYTRTEKANAIAAAVYQDLDQLFSMMSKRSNFMTASGWQKDLGQLRSVYNTKDRDETKKWLKIVGLAALGVAAVGLASWGIASAVYAGKYNARKTELQQHFDEVKAQLDAHYNNLNNQLTQDEQNYLNDNGYVWGICSTYEQPDSISCNRYNYQLFSGTKYCAVYCYKQASTGHETLHSAPTCTSPFIPSDCYDPNEYTQGYNDGYYDGYGDGYYDGSDDGTTDGANDGYADGYDTGESDGYSDGYASGFSDGYASYWGPALTAALTAGSTTSAKAAGVVRASSAARGDRFDLGYKAGLRDARTLLKQGA